MSSHTLPAVSSLIESSATIADQEILAQIEEHDVISLDTLVVLLPQYSWSTIFHAVDRLARCGKVVLRRHRFDYTLFSRHYST